MIRWKVPSFFDSLYPPQRSGTLFALCELVSKIAVATVEDASKPWKAAKSTLSINGWYGSAKLVSA